MPRSPAPSRAPRRPPRGRASTDSIDLALQGGGSHGAFTWGVLDRLLQEPDIAFDGVSGTSAGALNAGVLATGLAHGGRDGARRALDAFWRDVAGHKGCFGAPDAGTAAPLPTASAATAAAAPFWSATPWPLPGWPSAPAEDLPWMKPFADWGRQLSRALQQFTSPYQFNPLGLNPLRAVVERHVDLRAIAQGSVQVFVTATSVHTGQAEVFQGERLSVDAFLASACLPHLFQAVEIDGVPYWDGGYTGNPALWPLIYGTRSQDVVLVKINPLERLHTPQTALAIADRVGEISFNAGLTAELRAIAFVQRLLREQRLEPGRYKDLRLHMVHDEQALATLGVHSKLDTRWDFLQALHAMGEQAAQRWLAEHRSDLGRRSSLDIEATFLRRRDPRPAAPARG